MDPFKRIRSPRQRQVDDDLIAALEELCIMNSLSTGALIEEAPRINV